MIKKYFKREKGKGILVRKISIIGRNKRRKKIDDVIVEEEE